MWNSFCYIKVSPLVGGEGKKKNKVGRRMGRHVAEKEENGREWIEFIIIMMSK